MARITRYGKKNILSLKSGFIHDNDVLLEDLLRINAMYASQPRRTNCKACNSLLPLEGGFEKHGVAYVLCICCGHLNGRNEDTDEFCEAVYSKSRGADYARIYTSADAEAYKHRVNEIYLPKAKFLSDALGEGSAVNMRFADLGAGSGYFVSALMDCGFHDVIGYEVSESQIQLARSLNPQVKLIHHGLEDICMLASTMEADVVSMIGVLEHLREPRSVMKALCGNANISYIYLSVPLFSPSVIFEALFPHVMPRNLSGGHTHLFTENSLAYIANEFGLENVAEWWFGTDVMDLFRSVVVQLGKNPSTATLAEFSSLSFLPILDDLQLVIDRNRLASEVHVLYRIIR